MGGNADAEPYARDCMPLHAGPTGTSSVGPVVNDGTTSLTVTGVELVRPVDMSLVEGVFVPREQPYNTVPYPPPPDE
ncbi:hypothetical protein, partial [Actinoalloteichus caeruleus]